MILAGDAGGTNTRLALFESHAADLQLLTEQIYPSKKYKGLEEIVTEFLQKNSAKPNQAGIGVAGPIRDGRCVATNLPWIVDAAKLAAAAGLPQVVLLNDLEANAYGIATLPPADLAVIQQGIAYPKGNAAVISAGTGLGEAGMYWDGTTLRPFAAEGGHSSFAPEGELQGELFQYLARKFGHVSCERVLSGPGLVNVYEFFRDTGRGAEPAWLADDLRSGDPAAVISSTALAGKSDLCVSALDLFVQAYGAEAGNLALHMLATAGIYIGGGIAPKILQKLKSSLFLDAFLAKGRMKPLLEAIPVRVILNENTALRGAARGAILNSSAGK